MRCIPGLLLASACALCARPANAQRPGEIAGVVIDAGTSAAIEGVDIALPALQRTAVTDGSGRFTLRGLEPGDWTLRIGRFGFEAREVRVTVRNGETTRHTIRLVASPVALAGIAATADRDALAGTRIDRAALERSEARTAGDALRTTPGVVVRATGPGSPQTVSIRGMAPDAVLVLVDGVPLNDAVTGEADLSTVDAASIASIVVLPGARSARWGPRAAAGVILIETRKGGAADRRAAFGAGSLGGWDGAVSWGGGRSSTWNAGVSLRGQDGAFDYELPAAIGGGSRRRANADVATLEAHAGGGVGVAGGRLDARVSYDALERGLPGRGFAESPFARQESGRGRASLAWHRTGAAATLSALFAGTHQRITSHDAAPPLGLPYGDTTRTTFIETRLNAERALNGGATAGAGVELRQREIGGTILDAASPTTQFDAGVFVHGDIPLDIAGARFRLGAQARLDRNPNGGVVPSHSVTLGWSVDEVALYVAHRSSYSPPTAGDMYFRDAVGIEPNPDLDAERVPREVEIGASLRRPMGGWSANLRAAAYHGDVDGMILWAPDYRFVWSPYNQDAKRSGVDASAELVAPRDRARITGTWSFARATYDRGAGDDDVQIAYRPRRTAHVDGAIRLGSTRLSASARYTGERTTAATDLNMLSGFWTFDAGATHELSIAAWAAVLELRVERVLDRSDTLIFGFPEPGRILRFGIRLSPGTPFPPAPGVGS